MAIGFADMWRDCEKVAVGVCPPLLACLVLLGGMNAWMQIWQMHDEVTVDAWQMLAAVATALPYVFISRAMFPGQGDEAQLSLEQHYLKHRMLLLVLLAMPVAAQTVSKALLYGIYDIGWKALWMAVRIGAPLSLIPLPRRAAQRIGLAVLNGLLVLGLFR